MLMNELRIGNRVIGPNSPCFIIAEIGMNHNGDVELAKKTIDAAADAGADAVKFQMFTAEKLVTKDAVTYGAVKGHLPKYQQEMYKKYELTKEQYDELKRHADRRGVVFFASVWDEENADLLEQVGGEVFKVGSADITHLPMLDHIARKQKPIILSTGMSTMDEIREAVDAIKKHHAKLALLHCISSYPAKAEDAHLRSMQTLGKEFGCPVGFSDHTPGVVVDVTAVALGAKIIEKHFTIDKQLPGVDHHLSLDPKELREMVDAIRLVESTLGRSEKHVTAAEQETRRMARRSVIAKVDIPAGTVITKDMLVVKRPGTGLAPKLLHSLIGKKSAVAIPADTVLQEGMIK
jgi:N-acetylneuraminate synthase/N,N'-diacetyllegionaminate synthase